MYHTPSPCNNGRCEHEAKDGSFTNAPHNLAALPVSIFADATVEITLPDEWKACAIPSGRRPHPHRPVPRCRSRRPAPLRSAEPRRPLSPRCRPQRAAVLEALSSAARCSTEGRRRCCGATEAPRPGAPTAAVAGPPAPSPTPFVLRASVALPSRCAREILAGMRVRILYVGVC